MTPDEYFKNVCGIRLEPCPFCGGEAHVIQTSQIRRPWEGIGGNSSGYAIGCKVCGVATASYGDVKKAEEQWNKRSN